MSDASDQPSVTFNLRLAAYQTGAQGPWYYSPDQGLALACSTWRENELQRARTSSLRYLTISAASRTGSSPIWSVHIPIIPTEIQAQDTPTRVGECYHTACDCCGKPWDFTEVAIIAYGWTAGRFSSVNWSDPLPDPDRPYVWPDARGVGFRLLQDGYSVFSFAWSDTDGLLAGPISPYGSTTDAQLLHMGTAGMTSVLICQRATGTPAAPVATDAGAYAVTWADGLRTRPLRQMTDTDVTWQPWVPSTSTLDLGMPAYSYLWPYLGSEGRLSSGAHPTSSVVGYRRTPDGSSMATPGYDQCRVVSVIIPPYCDTYGQEYQGGVPQYGPEQIQWIPYHWWEDSPDTLNWYATPTGHLGEPFATEDIYFPGNYEIVGYYYMLGYDWPHYPYDQLSVWDSDIIGLTVDGQPAMAYMMGELDRYAREYEYTYWWISICPIWRYVGPSHAVPAATEPMVYWCSPATASSPGWWERGTEFSGAAYVVDMWSPRRDMPPPYPVMGLDGNIIAGDSLSYGVGEYGDFEYGGVV